MIELFDKKGKKVKVMYKVDAQTAIESGEYFESNPLKKVEEEIKVEEEEKGVSKKKKIF